MITDNKDKKVLVERLIQDKVITIEDAYLLLDEKEQQDISYPVYPQPYYAPWTIPTPLPWQQPFYYGDIFRVTCGSPTYVVDGSCTITDYTITDVTALGFPGTGVTYTMN